MSQTNKSAKSEPKERNLAHVRIISQVCCKCGADKTQTVLEYDRTTRETYCTFTKRCQHRQQAL